MDQMWKVGELARLTGLTVRTLHHYDAIGLLRPSYRTSAGHRCYGEGDVRRLYRVVALRELGLPLDRIAAMLSPDGEITDLLAEHLRHVEAQVIALRALRDRLVHLVQRTEQARQPSSADLLALIDEVTKMEETIKNYFTEEQLAALVRRRENLGAQAIADVQAEWPELIGRMQAELAAGTDPADPKVWPLAARWMELLVAFHGDDSGIRDGLYRMYEENSGQIAQQYGGPSPELIEYVKRVNAARA